MTDEQGRYGPDDQPSPGPEPQWTDGAPTTSVPMAPVVKPSAQHPVRAIERRGGGPGIVLGALLALVVAFAAGLTIGHGIAPAAEPTATATTAAVVTPAPTSGATVTPGASSSAAASSGATGTPSTTPSGEPATPSPEPTPTATATPAEPTPSLPTVAPADFGLVWEALGLIRDHYVDRSSLTDQQLTYGAIRGIVDALGDTGHSIFLTKEDLAAEQQSLNGTISGIGAALGQKAGQAIIVSVIPDTPADHAGLLAGDLILAVDGDSVDGLTTQQIVAKVRGDAGTQVTLTIQHPGDTNTKDVTITRAVITVPAVTWTMIPGTTIADIRLIEFSTGAHDAVKTALQAALDAGATKFVLDMRSNPGGLVDEAVGIASEFLADGVVYQREDSTGAKTPVDARDGGIATDQPLVVIVDGGTASSAEIVSGALQDNGRAKIVGTKTFGTGTVLNTFPLSDGSAIRLGVEHWLTPNGDLIFGHGIQPDEVVALPTDGAPLEPGEISGLTPAALAASSDAQLLRAIAIVTAETAP